MAVMFISPSGLADGEPLLVTGTDAGTAQTVHTATNTAGEKDVIELYAENVDISAIHTLYKVVGGQATPTPIVIEACGPVLIHKGMLSGGKVVKVYTDATSKIYVTAGNCVRKS